MLKFSVFNNYEQLEIFSILLQFSLGLFQKLDQLQARFQFLTYDDVVINKSIAIDVSPFYLFVYFSDSSSYLFIVSQISVWHIFSVA